MSKTPYIPYIFGASHAITNQLMRRKGIVKAESGHTSDKSQYFTAFKAVTVAIALRIVDAESIKKYSEFRA